MFFSKCTFFYTAIIRQDEENNIFMMQHQYLYTFLSSYFKASYVIGPTDSSPFHPASCFDIWPPSRYRSTAVKVTKAIERWVIVHNTSVNKALFPHRNCTQARRLAPGKPVHTRHLRFSKRWLLPSVPLGGAGSPPRKHCTRWPHSSRGPLHLY